MIGSRGSEGLFELGRGLESDWSKSSSSLGGWSFFFRPISQTTVLPTMFYPKLKIGSFPARPRSNESADRIRCEDSEIRGRRLFLVGELWRWSASRHRLGRYQLRMMSGEGSVSQSTAFPVLQNSSTSGQAWLPTCWRRVRLVYLWD